MPALVERKRLVRFMNAMDWGAPIASGKALYAIRSEQELAGNTGDIGDAFALTLATLALLATPDVLARAALKALEDCE